MQVESANIFVKIIFFLKKIRFLTLFFVYKIRHSGVKIGPDFSSGSHILQKYSKYLEINC